jgi:2-dehydropantoate 2-reductase
MKILFVGAGAVGSYLGGWLSSTDNDVTIIDPWSEQVNWVNKNGIEVSGPHNTFTAKPRLLHLHQSEELSRESLFDIGFIAMKAYDTEWATQFINKFIDPDGLIISAQNCWPDPLIAKIVGENRTAGLVMSNISVELYNPGKVSRPGHSLMRDLGHNVFRIGAHNGKKTDLLEKIRSILDVIDSSVITDNLWGERWAKLSQNCMGNPVVAMSNLGTAELAQDPNCRKLQINLAREAAEIGAKLGYKFDSFGGASTYQWLNASNIDTYNELDNMIKGRSNGPNRRPSMGQDVYRGRKTEIRYMNGFVLDHAKEMNISLPYTELTVKTILKIDSKEIIPDRKNIYSIIESIK